MSPTQRIYKHGGAEDYVFKSTKALDDCFALRAVCVSLAAVFGVRPGELLRPFVVELDSVASLGSISMLCE